MNHINHLFMSFCKAYNSKTNNSPSLVNFKKKVKVFLFNKMVSVEQNEFILY